MTAQQIFYFEQALWQAVRLNTKANIESKLPITDKNSVNFVFLLASVAFHSAFSFRTQHFVQRVEI